MRGMDIPALVAAQGGIISETVTPGVLGFLVICVIAAALYFLMKSMRRRLDNVRFDEAEPERRSADADEETPKA